MRTILPSDPDYVTTINYTRLNELLTYSDLFSYVNINLKPAYITIEPVISNVVAEDQVVQPDPELKALAESFFSKRKLETMSFSPDIHINQCFSGICKRCIEQESCEEKENIQIQARAFQA